MRKKSQSIRTRLLLPIFAILVIQCVLFLVFVVLGGFVESLRENAIAIFNENTENGKLYLEKEMVHRWMQVLNSDETLMEEIEITLSEENQGPEAIKEDPELNKRIMENLTQPIMNLLHRSYATGVFVVLDGPAAENSGKDKKAGVYIRDLDTSSYASDNSDLLLERGAPCISKTYGIPLDSFWKLGFSLSDQDACYYNSINAARENGAAWEERSNYCYISLPISIHPMDIKVITCSIPLITKDGTIIGAMGVDMTLGQARTLLDAWELDSSGNAISFLGVRKKGETTIKKVVTNGALYKHYFLDAPEITYSEDKDYDIARVESEDGTPWYASIKKIETYNHNTPFEEEEWVVVGLVRSQDLMTFYKKVQQMLFYVLALSLIMGTAGVFIISRMITDPIARLVEELRQKPRTGQLSLTRLSINEIDELTESIEKLSADVAESASKISSILENANISIGVYEFEDENSPVFCSRSFFEAMRWEQLDVPYIYMEFPEFLKRMEPLKEYRVEEEEGIYYFEDPMPRWMKMIIVWQKNGNCLGVFSDVTSEQLEKMKLERERDYDLLTNIYNRRAFRAKSQKLIEKQPDQIFAVIMWDMDNLKYINDTYGHDEGDRYIMLFAEKLHRLEQEGGLISRYAGDEFMTLLYDENGMDGIRKRMEAFMDYLHGQVIVVEGGYRMPIRVSAGIAWYPKDSLVFDTLITYADFAMYTVKHSVKGMVMEFEAKAYADNSYMLAGLEELNSLLEKKTVDFAYQPVVDRQGAVYGYELLMRPRLKTLKNIVELLNLAKAQAKLSQMESLTWMGALASIDEQTKRGKLGTTERLFINSITNVKLPERDIEELEKTYIGYFKRIVVELTENEPMEQGSLTYKLELFRKWGASTAIDDFGSGYNSEAVLLDVDPDMVKIDMTMVRNLDKDKNRQLLLKNIISFTKKAGITVLAEGVETVEELEILMEFGVDLFQGYYMGRPESEIYPIAKEVVDKMKELAHRDD